MKNLILIATLLLFASCGADIDVSDSQHELKAPEGITFGPDFEGAAAFCDERYGVDTDESEDCFQDYRNYFSAEVVLNLDSIVNYCEGNYDTEEEIEGYDVSIDPGW